MNYLIRNLFYNIKSEDHIYILKVKTWNITMVFRKGFQTNFILLFYLILIWVTCLLQMTLWLWSLIKIQKLSHLIYKYTCWSQTTGWEIKVYEEKSRQFTFTTRTLTNKKHLGLPLDRRLTWKFHMKPKSKQIWNK